METAVSAEFVASPIIPGGTVAGTHDPEGAHLERIARTMMHGQSPKSRKPEALELHRNADRDEIMYRTHVMNKLASRGWSHDRLRDAAIKWGWA